MNSNTMESQKHPRDEEEPAASVPTKQAKIDEEDKKEVTEKELLDDPFRGRARSENATNCVVWRAYDYQTKHSEFYETRTEIYVIPFDWFDQPDTMRWSQFLITVDGDDECTSGKGNWEEVEALQAMLRASRRVRWYKHGADIPIFLEPKIVVLSATTGGDARDKTKGQKFKVDPRRGRPKYENASGCVVWCERYTDASIYETYIIPHEWFDKPDTMRWSVFLATISSETYSKQGNYKEAEALSERLQKTPGVRCYLDGDDAPVCSDAKLVVFSKTTGEHR